MEMQAEASIYIDASQSLPVRVVLPMNQNFILAGIQNVFSSKPLFLLLHITRNMVNAKGKGHKELMGMRKGNEEKLDTANENVSINLCKYRKQYLDRNKKEGTMLFKPYKCNGKNFPSNEDPKTFVEVLGII